MHCFTPFSVIEQSINSGLYLTSDKNSLYWQSSYQIQGRLFFYLNQWEAIFSCDSACLMNTISELLIINFKFCLLILFYIIFILADNININTDKMLNDREQQIRLHHQKWKKWKIEMKKEDEKVKKQTQIPLESPQNYAQKIIKKLNVAQQSKCPTSTKFEKQFESNACSVCYELMVPPRNPLTLFPCGHNMCKLCLFVDGDKKLKNYQMKIKNCPLCKSKISNHAQNRNLMNLINSYTNNKNSLDKDDEEITEIADVESSQSADRLRLRYEILEKQKRSIALMLAKQKKQKRILTDVMEKLDQEKKKNFKQFSALQQQNRLIDKFLADKKQELQKIKIKIANTEEKKRVVEKTLQPLRTQKQKLQVLQAAKMLNS